VLFDHPGTRVPRTEGHQDRVCPGLERHRRAGVPQVGEPEPL
jgi:hypothetical protein